MRLSLSTRGLERYELALKPGISSYGVIFHRPSVILSSPFPKSSAIHITRMVNSHSMRNISIKL